MICAHGHQDPAGLCQPVLPGSLTVHEVYVAPHDATGPRMLIYS